MLNHVSMAGELIATLVYARCWAGTSSEDCLDLVVRFFFCLLFSPLKHRVPYQGREERQLYSNNF